LYNDTYNNLRPRLFDGSHLDFPGMNQNIKLRPHQDDAVWRGMSSGNTLLAHVVGAGKTFTMAATGMKMKQAGLVKKPMYVVPNHLLEQFSREFMQLYPNAKLLVAAKEDLSRDRRKMLTAKIASGEPPSVSELATRIKAIKAAHNIEATPQRVRQKQSSAEEPITRRIRRRAEAVPVSDAVIPPDAPMPEAETSPSAESTVQASVEDNSPRGFPSNYAGIWPGRCPARPVDTAPSRGAR
jgi:N12 class adenine-specific DNA methylase